MHPWLNLLYWLVLAILSGGAVVLLFTIAKVDLLTLGELIVLLTVSGVFSTGVVRTFTDWSLTFCILAGVVLAIPMSWLFAATFAVIIYLVCVCQRE